jgi:hypothetical protein
LPRKRNPEADHSHEKGGSAQARPRFGGSLSQKARFNLHFDSQNMIEEQQDEHEDGSSVALDNSVAGGPVNVPARDNGPDVASFLQEFNQLTKAGSKASIASAEDGQRAGKRHEEAKYLTSGPRQGEGPGRLAAKDEGASDEKARSSVSSLAKVDFAGLDGRARETSAGNVFAQALLLAPPDLDDDF